MESNLEWLTTEGEIEEDKAMFMILSYQLYTFWELEMNNQARSRKEVAAWSRVAILIGVAVLVTDRAVALLRWVWF